MFGAYGRKKRTTAQSSSRLLFSTDEVNEPTNPLVRIIRALFYREGVTINKFVDIFARYWQRERRDPNKLAGQRHNTLRTLQKVDQVSWRAFEGAVLRIFRMEMIDVTVTLRKNDTGEIFKISSGMIAKDDGLHDPVTGEIYPIHVPASLIQSTKEFDAIVAGNGNDPVDEELPDIAV